MTDENIQERMRVLQGEIKSLQDAIDGSRGPKSRAEIEYCGELARQRFDLEGELLDLETPPAGKASE